MIFFRASAIFSASLILLAGCATNSKPVNNSLMNEAIAVTAPTTPVIVDKPIDSIISEKPIINDSFKENINSSYESKSSKKENRFNFIINNTPISTVLSALVDGSSYSMVFPNELTGNISLNLKNVTAFDILETLKSVYHYEYEVKDKRIIVYPNGIRTKVFTINHLVGLRQGKSELKISSGSLSNNSSNNSTSTSANTNNSSSNTGSESSKITTTIDSDFWKEVAATIENLAGNKKETNVVVSPQTNTIVVKAMPHELIEIEKYLKQIQVIIDRQVIIEAKLIEVQLKNSLQTGINWAAFQNGANSRTSLGFSSANSNLANSGDLGVSGSNPVTATPGSNLLTGALGSSGSMLSLAFQTSNFASVLNFLETQGNLQVLSSPRIATMNNEKAILKVGTDEFFITNVTTTSTVTSAGTTNTPSITTQPFFSGIALDITPQIDEYGFVTMHVKPSVSLVSTVTKNINLGALGSIVLPLASSSISEIDSVVKVESNKIVAIGGLMKQYSKNDKNQVPGLGDINVIGNAFKSTDSDYQKYELVILLKPQVISTKNDWDIGLEEVHKRLLNFDNPVKNLIIDSNIIKKDIENDESSLRK